MQNTNHIWKEVVPLPGPQYERCTFMSIQGEGEFPNFLFRINTEHGEGGPLLLSVELFLYPDKGFWRFVNNHPQWKTDIRPLLLMLVQDIFWKFKIIDCAEEPFKAGGRNADPKYEGGLDFQLL